jgi:dethiobiotin synthetase
MADGLVDQLVEKMVYHLAELKELKLDSILVELMVGWMVELLVKQLAIAKVLKKVDVKEQ